MNKALPRANVRQISRPVHRCPSLRLPYPPIAGVILNIIVIATGQPRRREMTHVMSQKSVAKDCSLATVGPGRKTICSEKSIWQNNTVKLTKSATITKRITLFARTMQWWKSNGQEEEEGLSSRSLLVWDLVEWDYVRVHLVYLWSCLYTNME